MMAILSSLDYAIYCQRSNAMITVQPVFLLQKQVRFRPAYARPFEGTQFLAVYPGDSQDVCGTGGAERNPRGNDDPLAEFRNLFAVGDPDRFLHHVAKAFHVACIYAVRTPQD